MIASLRGLAVLGVVTLARALCVVLDRGGPPGVVDRALVPHLARAQVTALRWDRPGAPPVALARGAGRWTWTTPPLPADAAAVTDVLDTLESARWHRRGPVSAAGAIATTLHVRDARGDHAIGIGRPLPGADQVWLVAGGRALLVDGWVARALDPAPVALRVRHPLAGAAGAEGIAVTGVATPLVLRAHLRRRADGVWVAPAMVRALVERLAQVTYVKLPAGDGGNRSATVAAAVTVTVTVTGIRPPGAPVAAPAHTSGSASASDSDSDSGSASDSGSDTASDSGPAATASQTPVTAAATATATAPRAPSAPSAPVTVTSHGPCPGDPSLVLLSAPTGDGCVAAADWRAALAAAAALAGPPAAVADRRAVPFAPHGVAFADGSVALAGHAHVALAGGTRDVDPARTADLVAACATEGTWAATPPPRGAPLSRLTATGGHGETATLELYAGDLVHRDDGAWLHVSHDAWTVLAGPAAAFVDPTRWDEDATAITQVTLDGTTFARGAVIGEWRGAKDPAAVEALAQTLAEVRAPTAPLPAGFHAARVVEVVFAPPVGAPSHHRLELGAPRADGCPARIDGKPALAPLALCTAAAAAR